LSSFHPYSPKESLVRPVIQECDDGSAQLTLFGSEEPTQAVFEESGWCGNGYDWGAVAQALARMKLPDGAGSLFFDPEGDYLLVLGPNRAALEELAGWLQAAMQDGNLLREAMRLAEEWGLDGCTHDGQNPLPQGLPLFL
jgi:hypothetical protein